MKITFFINTLSSGGAEHQLSILANLLVDKGYDISIATYGDVKDHYYIRPEIKRIRLGKDKSKYHKILSIFNFFRTAQSDVFISFCQQNNLISGLALLLGVRKTKFIVGERNFSIKEPSLIERVLFNIIYRKSYAIVPNNYSQAKYIISHAPWLAHKINVIINYTDTSVYIPVVKEYSPPYRFCVVARYDGQKNYRNFAYAIKKLNDSGLRFHVDWFGAKSDGIGIKHSYLEFESIISALELNDIIKLHDSQTNIQNILPQYDFYCLPSLYEGFSNSIAEAICCGLPIVCSDISDNNAMVKNGVNGYLFNPDDIDDMAKVLMKMISNSPSILAEMGMKSRELALSLFDKDSFVNNYIQLIDY